MSVLTSIIVRLSRQYFIFIMFCWHDYSGHTTRLAGCVTGGVTFMPPLRGQVNVQSNNYWSATEYAPNTNNAWNFNMNNGNQNANNKNNSFYGWAVQSG